MNFGQMLRKCCGDGLRRLLTSSRGPTLLSGVLLGTLAVAAWISWAVTWGDDRAFAGAALMSFAVGWWFSHLLARITKSARVIPLPRMGVIVSAWALLLPALVRGTVFPLRGWSMSVLAEWQLLVAVGVSVPIWLTTGMLFGWTVRSAVRLARTNGNRDQKTFAEIALGSVIGIGITGFVIGPVFGVQVVCAAATICSLVVWAVSPTVSIGTSSGTASASEPAFGTRHFWSNGVILMATGGLFVPLLRLLSELMPHSAYVEFAAIIGILLGMIVLTVPATLYRIVGRRSDREWSCRPDTPVLLAATVGALSLALHPRLVDLSLWMNATLIWPVTLMAGRVSLIALAMAPLGTVMAMRRSSEATSGATVSSGAHLVLITLGAVLAAILDHRFSFTTVLAVCCSLLVATALLESRSLPASGSLWRRRLIVGSLSLCGLISPLFAGHYQPARLTKLLFSTPAFVGYRSGWDTRLLTQLDASRLLLSGEGTRGAWTLWRNRGLDLQLRENGVPRSTVSIDTRVQPQFPPEVLQAVLPLVMVDRPGRVLVLGASGGVSLATCLRFPIHSIECVEGDPQLIELLRGPVARETGLDPFADERVKLIRTTPELALAGARQPFDVVIGAAVNSSLTAGAALYTVEFYRQAARQLTDNGVFCQRFECVDYGPEPLRSVLKAMQAAFPHTLAVESSNGDLLLLGSRSQEVFVPQDLATRLESDHVRTILSRSGLDWTTPLGLAAYDGAALAEIANEVSTPANSSTNGLLTLKTPWEVARWGRKQYEMAVVLTKQRTSPVPESMRGIGANRTASPSGLQMQSDAPKELDNTKGDVAKVSRSRKSRLLDWLGDDVVTAELMRRMSEVAQQQQIVRENPESHWWEYRKALRKQLQDHPRAAVQLVRHVNGERRVHPEDLNRKRYFEALGEAAKRSKPTVEQLVAIEACLEPHDPLLSYFAHQEIADLRARTDAEFDRELIDRLHVINYAPAMDSSTRNVATAMDLLVKHPEIIPDPARRYDILNGLVQAQRTRWELKQSIYVKSVRRQLEDVNRSLLAIERALAQLEELAPSASVPPIEWSSRKQAINRLLLRDLRGYQTLLQTNLQANEGKTKALLDNATRAEDSSRE